MTPGESCFRFGIAVLATWRVTHLLASEDGPGDLVVRLRARLGHGPIGRAMDCFQCLSVWVAAPASLTVARRPRELVPVWLAVSGAACLLEKGSSTPVIFEHERGRRWRRSAAVARSEQRLRPLRVRVRPLHPRRRARPLQARPRLRPTAS